MKYILLIVWFLISISNATAIQVSGEGRTFEEAKHNAFRTAIEIVVGTVVASEREAKSYQLVKNDILVYSAGYIDKYTIVSKNETPNYVRLIVDIDVASSKLKDFLLSPPQKIVEFSADSHQAQIDTYYDERRTGDQLIESVIKHYPYKAFNLKQLPYEFKVSTDRKITLIVPYELTWNYNYLISLNETLARVADAETRLFKRAPGRIQIESKSPNNFLIGQTDLHHFNDLVRLNAVKQGFLGDKEVRLQLVVTDIHNKNIINICMYPVFLTGYQNPLYSKSPATDFKIFGNEIEKSAVTISLNNGSRINVSEILHINLKVVTNKDCRYNRLDK